MSSRTRTIPKREKDPESGRYFCRHWDCSNIALAPRRYWCSQACVDDALIQSSSSHARTAVFKRDRGICWICWRDCDAIKHGLHQLKTIAATGICCDRRTGYQVLQKQAAKSFGFIDEPGRITEAIDQAAHRLSEARRLLQEQFQQSRPEAIRHRYRVGNPYNPKPYGLENPVDEALADHLLAISNRLQKLAAARLKRWSAELTEEGFDISRTTYWDADHILPVVEGGGGCGLNNLRTLCQPCHKRATRELAARRAKDRRDGKAAALRASQHWSADLFL
jgi:5-methylcytosine-specific restriction endonuclease McrA